MKCVTCGSQVQQLDPSAEPKCELCGVALCPGDYGFECKREHERVEHPEKGMPNASILDRVRSIKAEIKRQTDRALVAEGLVTHWQAVSHDTEINWKAKWGALIKWMSVACPDQLARVEKLGMASRADILPEA